MGKRFFRVREKEKRVVSSDCLCRNAQLTFHEEAASHYANILPIKDGARVARKHSGPTTTHVLQE